ncbi:hypothetical protein ACFWID_41485, partial [Streptomyces sp. NPDC127040]
AGWGWLCSFISPGAGRPRAGGPPLPPVPGNVVSTTAPARPGASHRDACCLPLRSARAGHRRPDGQPLALPAPADPAPDTPADAVAELLTGIARRQREHRQRTADRLTAVLDTGLLPAELTEMAL